MTKEEVKSGLAEYGNESAEMHDAFLAFCQEMESRQYGADALNDAWNWYSSGYDFAAEML